MQYAYCRTKRLGEQRAQAAADGGQDVVIACPGFVIGAGDVNRISTFTIEQYLRGTLRFTIPGGLSYVDARDVVAGLLRLEASGISGRRYVLTSEDGNLSHRDFFGLVGEVAGKKRLTVPLPPAMRCRRRGCSRRCKAPLPVKPDELALGRALLVLLRRPRARRARLHQRPVREAIAETRGVVPARTGRGAASPYGPSRATQAGHDDRADQGAGGQQPRTPRGTGRCPPGSRRAARRPRRCRCTPPVWRVVASTPVPVARLPGASSLVADWVIAGNASETPRDTTIAHGRKRSR